MKIAFLFLALLALAGTAEYRTLRDRADGLCRSAHELARHGRRVAGWVREAAADPYLGDAALRGPPRGVLAKYRRRAGRFGEELGAHLLPKDAVAAFTGLHRAKEGEVAAALEALGPAAARMSCESGVADEELARLVSAADLFWAERRAVAAIEKQRFARDRAVYCREQGILLRLRGVADAAEDACRHAKAGTRLASKCASGHVESADSLRTELKELEERKELNLRKLRQKWPAGVMAELRC